MDPAIVHDVPEYTWVKLAQAGSSENVRRAAGDTCSLLKGGSVTVLGVDKEFGTLLQYSLPAGKQAVGALCHNGALVFLPSDVVSQWPAKGEVTKAMAVEDQSRADAVKRVLSRED